MRLLIHVYRNEDWPSSAYHFTAALEQWLDDEHFDVLAHAGGDSPGVAVERLRAKHPLARDAEVEVAV